ncbi:helix-turn-helix domain-containing protein [Ningiella sp. W23]|uniref:helix-turn-helix domain-containing protein n=1 Tax=Ningiella sp. W23 TaxID=3023715 RepID=UPI003758250A
MTKSLYEERIEKFDKIERALNSGEATIGQAIRMIRTELYCMTQSDFAKFCGISDKTLRDIERGNTDPRLSIVSKLLYRGGFKLGASRITK